MPDLAALQKAIGITFKNPFLLEQALVHRSYLNEDPQFPLPSNERLEFLGDVILSFVVAERLYKDFPHLPEGELTKFRAALVRRETLASLAVSLELGEYLYLSRGEELSGGRHRQAILGRAFEAVVGAIYLDRGLARTRDFLFRVMGGRLEKIALEGFFQDYKSRLQEVTQARSRMAPIYRTVATAGPEHAKEFAIEVVVEGEVVGKGMGKSKKVAEQEAAREALVKLGDDS